MSRPGRDLEVLVGTLERILEETPLDVRSPDYITGRLSNSQREVDVSVRGRLGSTDVLVIFECRDRNQTQDIRWVEEVAQKREDVGAHRAVMVSSGPFTEGAQAMAAAKEIILRTIAEVSAPDVFEWLGVDVMRLGLRRADIKHVAVNLTEDAADEGVEHLRALGRPPSVDIGTEALVRTKDGSKASYSDAWRLLSSKPEMLALYGSLTPGERRKVSCLLNFTNPDDRFQLPAGDHLLDIKEILFRAEIWIDSEDIPLSRLHTYLEGDTFLAESVEATIDVDGDVITLAIHVGSSEAGQQWLSVSARPGTT